LGCGGMGWSACSRINPELPVDGAAAGTGGGGSGGAGEPGALSFIGAVDNSAAGPDINEGSALWRS